MAAIIPVGSTSNLLILVTFLGGLLGGLGMLCGTLLRDLVSGPIEPQSGKKRRRSKYR